MYVCEDFLYKNNYFENWFDENKQFTLLITLDIKGFLMT